MEMEKKMEKLENEMLSLKKEISGLRLWIIVGIVINIIMGVWKIYHPTSGVPLSNQNNVRIGGAEVVDPQRDYLTTEEVAAKEGVSVRPVVQWIAEGKISPAPEQGARAWRIAANYRILPQLAEEVARE